MTTNREIEKEIQDRTGLTGVRVSKAQGMCRFYSDNDISVDLSLTDAVYVPRLSDMSVADWADTLEWELKETGQWDAVKRVVIGGGLK